MSSYANVQIGRICTLTLESGEDLLLSVNQVLEKEHIQNAIFLAGTGTLLECHTHYADETLRQEVPVIIRNTPMELCGVSGFIEQKPGGAVTHLHGVIYDGTAARTAHIHEGCKVFTSFQLVIAEMLHPDEPNYAP